MDNETEKVTILKFNDESSTTVEDIVVREMPLTIILNNKELVTLLCSPKDLNYLAIGFLVSEGLLKSKGEIKKVTVDNQRGIVRVETTEDRDIEDALVFKRLITSGCGSGAAFYKAADALDQHKIESETKIIATEVTSLVRDFQHNSEVFRVTGGVHSAALCDNSNIIIFSEDIGRHNAIDKIFGECLLKDIATDEKVIVTSGRISSEILLKVAKRNIPIIISKSAPTDLALNLANGLGITLLGFVRGKRLNAYTNDWRIMSDGKQ